jgi:hypothetical protein
MTSPKVLLAALLVLTVALTIHGCAIFQATLSENGCDVGYLYGSLIDDGISTCIIAGPVTGCGARICVLNYEFYCINNYKLTFKTYQNVGVKGHLMYETPHGITSIVLSLA